MCKSKQNELSKKWRKDINQHRNEHINQAVGEQNKCKRVIINQKIYQQINQHLNQHINQNEQSVVLHKVSWFVSTMD